MRGVLYVSDICGEKAIDANNIPHQHNTCINLCALTALV